MGDSHSGCRLEGTLTVVAEYSFVWDIHETAWCQFLDVYKVLIRLGRVKECWGKHCTSPKEATPVTSITYHFAPQGTKATLSQRTKVPQVATANPAKIDQYCSWPQLRVRGRRVGCIMGSYKQQCKSRKQLVPRHLRRAV